MAEFLQGNQLNATLDRIIERAEQKLFLISPFIKFHQRIIEVLNTKKSLDTLQIVVVFGKNEGRKERSFGKEAFDYLAQFPNVIIKYEPRLHAKYYANESATLLSSMNLYEYSQNNNIEFGIYSETKGLLENLWNSKSLDSDAWNYFKTVVENSKIIYRKLPVYEDKLLGLKKKYVRSEVDIDNSNEIFTSKIEFKKSQPKPVTVPMPATKITGKLVSATVLGKTVGKSYKDVVEIMNVKGFIKEDNITAIGKNHGLDYKSNSKGDSWIVYPETLKEHLID